MNNLKKEVKEEAPIFEISHITDLFNVPADRLSDLLDDLKNTIPTLKKSYDALKDIDANVSPSQMFPTLKWKDDDSSYTQINVKVEDKTEVIKVKHKQ